MSTDTYNHRKATVELRFSFENGQPAVNQAVTLTQRGHRFLFGCGGFEAVELAGGTVLEEGKKAFLQDKLDKLFGFNNYATLPFYLGRYEHEEGKPEERRLKAAAAWYKERGIITKGHPLCWHTVCPSWLMNYPNETIFKKVIARIERDVAAFKGLIDIWDVINEVVIMPIFDKYDNAVTRICKDLGRVKLIKEVFQAARRANPSATLILNDFNTSIDYEILIDGCLQAGVPIDVIGIQSHQHQGYWGLEKLQEVLDRFAHFGLPLHFTENTLISGDLMPPDIVDLNDWQVAAWPSTPDGEERQKQEILQMYETLFACPAVEAITTWSGGDDAWLHAPAGFLRVDNSEKPSAAALKAKIQNEWSTRVEGQTNGTGLFTLEGFLGSYEVSSGSKKAVFELDGRKQNLEICLS